MPGNPELANLVGGVDFDPDQLHREYDQERDTRTTPCCAALARFRSRNPQSPPAKKGFVGLCWCCGRRR